MDAWVVVFLGIIALSSLVQAAFLIGLANGGRKLGRRLDELQNRLDREIKPALEQVQRVGRNLGEISDLAVLQARRIDLLIGDTVEKIEETTEMVRSVIVRPLGPLSNIVAILRGFQRGLEVFQQLRGFDQHGRPRRPAEDEHLFI